jgi:uncharacterized protein (UPF0332 family)
MKLDKNDKKDLAASRLEKAELFLSDAKTLLQASSYGSSANRGYYSMLSAARSLLILRGISADSHESVKTMISREFVKTGLLPKEMGEIFRSLHARRLDSDYGDYVEITEEEARDSLAKAGRFLSEVKRLSRSILEED